MSNKDDNATHLNDSQRNEDLELFRRNKNARQRRRRRIDNQSKKGCYVYTITVRD